LCSVLFFGYNRWSRSLSLIAIRKFEFLNLLNLGGLFLILSHHRKSKIKEVNWYELIYWATEINTACQNFTDTFMGICKLCIPSQKIPHTNFTIFILKPPPLSQWTINIVLIYICEKTTSQEYTSIWKTKTCCINVNETTLQKSNYQIIKQQ
jgi:hypothetical protein